MSLTYSICSNLGISRERYLTWANRQCLDLSDLWVTAYVIKVPAEKYFLCYWCACSEGEDVAVFQVHIPYIQIRHVSKERLREVPSK